MDVQELRNLLPQDKSDIERAKQIKALGFPAAAPILPEILEWMQDSNWPVAKELHNFVISSGTISTPHIKAILDGDDETWKYCILTSVVSSSPELARALVDGLRRVAFSPTAGERKEEVTEIAQEILADIKLLERNLDD